MVLATIRSRTGRRPFATASGRRRPGRLLLPTVVVLAAVVVPAAVLVPTAPAGAQEPTPGPEAERPRLPADSAVVRLQPLDVRVSPPSRRGKMTGFHRRRSRGAGEFITRRDIERRDPARLSDMVHMRAGVGTVPYGDGSGRQHVRMSRAALQEDTDRCRVQYWIDGVPFRGVNRFELDELSPADVEGIEIYRGPAEIPPRFNRRGSSCGVVAVWTRDPTRE